MQGGGLEFDALYRATPPWDIGRPQSAFTALAEAGAVRGRVLDAGCGTGEHALLAAALGLNATGIDAAPTAIALAEQKAQERGLQARFLVWDALELATLDERFDTVLDCGLLHVLSSEGRARYLEQVAALLADGGALHVLCFSDLVSGEWGPHRFTEEELRATFAGWHVDVLERTTLAVTFTTDGIPAWQVSARPR